MIKLNRSLFFFLFTYLFLFSLTSTSFSQTDSTHFKKWSLGIYTGELVPFYDLANSYDGSPLLGIKAEYNFKPYFSVYLRSSYNFLKPDYRFSGIFEEIPKINARCISTTIGVKYHPMESFKGLYTQIGIGHYYLEKRYVNLWDNFRYTNISNNFGFNFGMGYEINIFKNVKIEFGSDYNLINTRGPQTTAYLVFYIGVSIKF